MFHSFVCFCMPPGASSPALRIALLAGMRAASARVAAGGAGRALAVAAAGRRAAAAIRPPPPPPRLHLPLLARPFSSSAAKIALAARPRPRPLARPFSSRAAVSSSDSPTTPPRPYTPRPTHTCPACGQRCVRPGVFERHLGACCPDLIPRSAWRAAVEASTEDACLASAAAVEARLRAAAVRLAFRETDSAGDPVRRSAAEVAPLLGLPVSRVAASLKAAMRAVPLAVDQEPVVVLFEDAHMVAFAKPAGLITSPKHRYTGGSLVNRAIAHLGGSLPHPIHRLDQFTSGVVVMAKDPVSAASLHAQFRDRTAVKRYVALVVGRVGEEDGSGSPDPPSSSSAEACAPVLRDPSFPPAAFAVDAPIGRWPGHEVGRAALEPGDPEGAPSLTLFRPMGMSEALSAALASGADITPAPLAPPGTLAAFSAGVTLVCAAPRTGRTHQIRVHARAAGHPLVGDDLYGVLTPWAPRQLLHAATLDLTHPVSGEPLRLAAPLPPDFVVALEAVGLAVPGDLVADLPLMAGWGPPAPV